MARTNKFVHFNTREAFDSELERLGITDPSASDGNDFYHYTVFIKDTGEIYTHGKFYQGDYSEIKNDVESIKQNTYYFEVTDESGIISAEEYEKIKQAKIVCLHMTGIEFFLTYKLDYSLLGFDSVVYTGAVASIEEPYVVSVNALDIRLNSEDGQYHYTIIDESPRFKSINGQSITGDGNIEAVQPSALSEEIAKLERAIATKADSDDIPSVPTKVSDLTNDSGYQTASQVQSAVSGKQDVIQDLSTIRSGATKGATAVQPSSLAEVATSGSYSDLSDKPTIPAAVTESTVSDWGFTKNTGTYSKPSGGIPKSDLASAVQTSLGMADTAVQPAAIANFADKTSYASQSGVTSDTLQPNTFTDFGTVASLAITLGSVAADAPLEKRMFGFQFTSGTTATTLTLPDTVKFPEDPTIEAGHTYQMTILNNLALIVGWPNA